MKKSIQKEFLAWYKDFHEPFVRYCSGLAFGIISAEDLVQDTVLQTLQQYDKIRNKDKLASYMFGIVHNIVRNKRRRLKFRGDWDKELTRQLEAKAPSPEVATDIHFLMKAMDQLTLNQKSTLILFEISGYRIKEIAELQGESESAIKTQLHRSRKKLKSLLSEEENTKVSLQQSMAAFASILF